LSERWSALIGAILVSGLVLTSVSPAFEAHAAEQGTKELEIAYLIQQVRLPGCRFYRNGTWYEGERAQAHLRTKYESLSAHGQIHSAEDFIEKVASRSSLSGEAYQIQCAGQPAVPSSQWFGNLLVRYRGAKH
jgi:hypothetical protein